MSEAPARTLEKGTGVEFQARVADEGVIAYLLCDCGRVLCEAHVPDADADPDEVEADGGAALRERLLWGAGRIFFCSCNGGRMIRGRGGVS